MCLGKAIYYVLYIPLYFVARLFGLHPERSIDDEEIF